MKTSVAPVAAAPRVALYMRLSAGRQAEIDLSIPDQRRQGPAFCKTRGRKVVGEFVDAGLSGTNDKRPEVQRLLDNAGGGATGGPAPFDVVLVHSFSRFARDAFLQEMHCVLQEMHCAASPRRAPGSCR